MAADIREALIQYCDIKQEYDYIRTRRDRLIREIEKMEKEQMSVIDSVTGGDGGIQHYKIEGYPYPEYSRKRTLLIAREGQLQKYEMKFRLYFSDVKPKMAIFVSKLSHCLFDMLARYTAGEWNVEIPLIISNHPDLQHVAERFGIPFYLFPITKENKMEQEKAEMELLEKHNINFIVLARYMQVISEQMIEAYPNRIINIHHSFLPAFVGAKPYHAAFERGVKIIGATSHYVTSELDAGPIIEQDVVRITHKDTVQDLVSKGKDLEKIVLSRAVQKHIERKVLAYKNKTVIFS